MTTRVGVQWVMVGLLAGCTMADAASRSVWSAPELRQREEAIESILVARLGEDASTIRAVVLDSKVILTGRVEYRTTQELAKEVVLSLDGIERASNRIEARYDPSWTEGQILLEGKDVELETRVKWALLHESRDLARAIEVEAVDGIVSLRGVESDPSRRLRALDTVRQVDGVRQVLDLLRGKR